MYLRENAKIFQHLYTTLYPKFYSRNNKFGAENKLLFDLCYREWINSKNNQHTTASATVSTCARCC